MIADVSCSLVFSASSLCFRQARGRVCLSMPVSSLPFRALPLAPHVRGSTARKPGPSKLRPGLAMAMQAAAARALALSQKARAQASAMERADSLDPLALPSGGARQWLSQTSKVSAHMELACVGKNEKPLLGAWLAHWLPLLAEVPCPESEPSNNLSGQLMMKGRAAELLERFIKNSSYARASQAALKGQEGTCKHQSTLTQAHDDFAPLLGCGLASACLARRRAQLSP